MKKGWEYKKLGEIFPYIKNGANIKQSKGAGGIPITRIETLANGVFNYDRLGYADIIDAGKYEKNILSKGDILMSHINSLEHIGRAIAYKGDKKIIHGMNLLRLIPIESVNTDYCCFYFKTQNFKKAILSITHKSVNQASFNTSSLKSLSIPLPPLSEQKEIVEYLDSSFAKIDKLKENAAKNLEEAKALFQSALKDALEPKEGWEMKTLGELGSLKNGMNFTKNESGTELHILGVGDFGNLFSISNTENLPIISLNEIPSDDYMLENGDIVFVRSNGNKNLVGRCLLVYPGNIKTSFSGFCIRFRKNSDKVDAKYLAYFLKAPNTRKKIAGNGANISNLNQKVLQSLAIPFPPLSEQQSIVSFLDSLSEKVNTLQQNYSRICDECDALKQAILRQVFE